MQRESTDTCPYTIQAGDTLWVLAQRFNTSVEAIMLENPLLQAHNLRIGQVITIPRPCPVPPRPEPSPQMFCIGPMELTLSNHLRSLWQQHVYWTRMLITSMIFGLPDTEAVTARLLRNPGDFAAVFRTFYGRDIAAGFADLFTSHVKIAGELVTALKAGNNAAAADAEKRWYANAEQIASFLADINPNWSALDWRNMMYDHLAMIKTQAIDILNRRYTESITMSDEIEQQSLAMADTMTAGIVQQFPQYFR